MPVTVHIPSVLRAYCGESRKEFELSARNVSEALDEISEKSPSLYHSICDETGAIRQHVNLFVNETLVADRKVPLTTLHAGDDLFILPSVSGG